MRTSLRLSIAAFALAIFNLSAATLYVSLESTNPVAPFISWATAATNIQDAVDAATAGDTVLVTNGVYAVGGKTATNESGQLEWSRVQITNSVRLESVNGPLLTTIEGSQVFSGTGQVTNGVRCISLAANAILSGFTLSNGYAEKNGGDVWCASANAVLTNCTIAGGFAYRAGGGAYGGTLYDCTLSGNTVADCGQGGGEGGGASRCTLINCTLTANSACLGGGASEGVLNRCTLRGNSAGYGGGASTCTLNDCTLTANSAALGGGVSFCTLNNCMLIGNLATVSGGGASASTLNNCTLTANSAASGGGIARNPYGGASPILNNCIVYYNTAKDEANYDSFSFLNYCCATPMPTNGIGNISGPPLFMDMEAGDFRLREDSPCVDAGGDLTFLNVGYSYDPTDILGNTRFIDGNGDGKVAWDIGAYEFNSFKPPRFTSAPQLTAEGWKLNIAGAPNKFVRVQRSSNLKDWEDIWFGWMGSEGVKQATDGDPQGAMFYRVVVVP